MMSCRDFFSLCMDQNLCPRRLQQSQREIFRIPHRGLVLCFKVEVWFLGLKGFAWAGLHKALKAMRDWGLWVGFGGVGVEDSGGGVGMGGNHHPRNPSI